MLHPPHSFPVSHLALTNLPIDPFQPPNQPLPRSATYLHHHTYTPPMYTPVGVSGWAREGGSGQGGATESGPCSIWICASARLAFHECPLALRQALATHTARSTRKRHKRKSMGTSEQVHASTRARKNDQIQKRMVRKRDNLSKGHDAIKESFERSSLNLFSWGWGKYATSRHFGHTM